jgi:DNA polymerase-1
MKTALVDTPSLLYHTFFQDTKNALNRFANQIAQITKTCDANKAIFAFDSNTSFKSQAYPFYKQNRPPKPDAVAALFDEAKLFLRQKRLDVYEQNGYEADDVVATICAQNPQMNFIAVSKDKDFLQLLRQNVTLYDFSKNRFIDANGFFDAYGFKPQSFVDFQAFAGDSVDNIAGVRGVGAKSAKKLIAKYATIENVYTNIDQIRNTKVKQALLSQKEEAFIAKTLATLKNDLDLTPLQP